MHYIGKTDFPNLAHKVNELENHFLDYNYNVIKETEPTHNLNHEPTLKSKLLFMDYRFHRFTPATLYCANGNEEAFKEAETQKPIIKFGRTGYKTSDVRVPGGTAISRRHCVIINCKDDVWIYDLESTGTYLNQNKVIYKMPLIGRNIIRLGKTEYELTNDKTKLL